MNRLVLVVGTILFCGTLASTARAQEDGWGDDVLYDLADRLDGLSDMVEFEFEPNMFWAADECEDDDECDVRVLVDDGESLIVVNGDTLKDRTMRRPHKGHFEFKYGPGQHRWPKFDMPRDFTRRFMHERDPEIRRMEREARDLARKARQADGDERTALEKELDEKLNTIFDRKLENQQKAIERAQRRVEELKERRRKREEARDEIIEDRKEELIGRERYLEW